MRKYVHIRGKVGMWVVKWCMHVARCCVCMWSGSMYVSCRCVLIGQW